MDNVRRPSNKAAVLYAAFGGVTGWCTLAIQLYLTLNRDNVPELGIDGALNNFFSYFTILTNMLVAIFFTVYACRVNARVGKFFSRPAVQTAIAVYITFTGGVYTLLLKHLWDPQGLQLIVDEFLHTVIPAGVLVHWVCFVPKRALKPNDIFLWTLYPLCYLAYTLIRGTVLHRYPYPFLDVASLGYPQVLLNILFLTVGFVLLSLLFVGTARLIAGNSTGRKDTPNTEKL